MKKRANGKGTVVFLGKGRYKPWAARILIGKDFEGKPIYYDIDTFEEELDALVCLENYFKSPFPLKIKKKKYERIVTFAFMYGTNKPFPLVPVENITASIHRENKKYYTFKQVFEEMKKNLFPTKEERLLEKKFHIKPPNGKFASSNANHLITAFNQSQILYDKIYGELRTSDFKSCINAPAVKSTTKSEMVKLFKHMDKYAYSEDIIDKKYAESLKSVVVNCNIRLPFSYDEIKHLWEIKDDDPEIQFVRDFLLLSIYTGCRAEELLFIYTKNLFLDKNYFVAGLKTDAGINRTVPIHPLIKPIFEKYFDKNNEFLFILPNKSRMHYGSYLLRYKKFVKNYPEFVGKTAHCGRHALETEMQKLNIKQTIRNAIIGHKNGNVADDIYNHVSIEEKIEAINLVTYTEKKIYVLNTSATQKNLSATS